MPHFNTLAVVAGLAVAGSVAGLTLGRATIAEINPVHYQDDGTPFDAELAPARSTGDWQQVQAQEYQAAAQATSPAGCVGCTWPVDPMPRQDSAIARYDQPRATVPPPERAEAPVRIVVVESPPEPDWGRVDRYARYPVERNAAPAAGEADDGGDGGTQ
jgi:hypothetical protein